MLPNDIVPASSRLLLQPVFMMQATKNWACHHTKMRGRPVSGGHGAAAGKGLGLHDSQRVPPVERVGKSYQGEASDVGRALWFDVAFLIWRQLFAQKEVVCREYGTWAQTEEQKA
jgi:hypothetical protein